MDKEFLDYYFKVTPQKKLEFLFIGSRPSKRNKSNDIQGIESNTLGICLDTNQVFNCLRGLVRMKPLKYAVKNKKANTLKQMIINWPFFNSKWIC